MSECVCDRKDEPFLGSRRIWTLGDALGGRGGTAGEQRVRRMVWRVRRTEPRSSWRGMIMVTGDHLQEQQATTREDYRSDAGCRCTRTDGERRRGSEEACVRESIAGASQAVVKLPFPSLLLSIVTLIPSLSRKILTWKSLPSKVDVSAWHLMRCTCCGSLGHELRTSYITEGSEHEWQEVRGGSGSAEQRWRKSFSCGSRGQAREVLRQDSKGRRSGAAAHAGSCCARVHLQGTHASFQGSLVFPPSDLSCADLTARIEHLTPQGFERDCPVAAGLLGLRGACESA